MREANCACHAPAAEVGHGNVAKIVDVAAELGSTQTPRLPSFFVVGPPRTGTSWLYEILRPHASLPGPSKEIRFFDKHFHRGLKWYLAHYKKNGEQRMGEVAPTYFASAEARKRIAEIVPDAKIVCTFRNPVERIISLYRLKRAYGMIRCSVEEAIERDPEFMATSRYASHLRLWQKSFGAKNVLVGIYDDLRNNPQEFVDAVVNFVGVPRFSVTQEEQSGLVHNSDVMTHPRSHFRARTALMVADWFKSKQLDRLVVEFKRSRLRKLVHGGGPPFQAIGPELARQLYERLRPEIESLEAMLQRDLSSWKTPSLNSPEPA